MSPIMSGLFSAAGKAVVTALTNLFLEVRSAATIYNSGAIKYYINNAGELYAGMPEVYSGSGIVQGSRYSIYKYNPSGNVIWSASTTGRSNPNTSYWMYGYSGLTMVEVSGTLYYTASVSDGSGSTPPLIAKLTSSGIAQYVKFFGGDSIFNGLTSVTSGGNTYLVTTHNYADKSGSYTEIWVLNPTNLSVVSHILFSGRVDYRGLAFSSVGNNYLYAMQDTGSGPKIVQFIVNSNGTLTSNKIITFNTYLATATGQNILTDSSGYVYIWGQGKIIKLDFSTTNPTIVWQKQITVAGNGSANINNTLRSLNMATFDPNGDMIFVIEGIGITTEPSTPADSVVGSVLKLTGINTSSPSIAWVKKISKTTNPTSAAGGGSLSIYKATDSTIYVSKQMYYPAGNTYDNIFMELKNNSSNYSFTASNLPYSSSTYSLTVQVSDFVTQTHTLSDSTLTISNSTEPFTSPLGTLNNLYNLTNITVIATPIISSYQV